MKTKKFKIFAVVCAALFTVTLAIGIIFACLPKERRVEAAVPLADTTTGSCWDESHRELVNYTDFITCSYESTIPSFSTSAGDFYRAPESRITLNVEGYFTNYVGSMALTAFHQIVVRARSELTSDTQIALVFCLEGREISTSFSLPGYRSHLIFTGGQVPECIYLFFEYLFTQGTGYNSSYFTAKSSGYAEGYSTGHTLGSAEGYASGHTAGYGEGHTAGYEEGHIAGYDEGHAAGYNEGVEVGNLQDIEDASKHAYADGYQHGLEAGRGEGYQGGYTAGYDAANADVKASYQQGFNEGYNKGQSEKFINPVVLFLDPVHAFMNRNFFGGISYANVFNVIILVAIALVFIKMFR